MILSQLFVCLFIVFFSSIWMLVLVSGMHLYAEKNEKIGMLSQKRFELIVAKLHFQ
jgi:hypothetical protein